MELNQPDPTFISEGQYLTSFTGKLLYSWKICSNLQKKSANIYSCDKDGRKHPS